MLREVADIMKLRIEITKKKETIGDVLLIVFIRRYSVCVYIQYMAL